MFNHENLKGRVAVITGGGGVLCGGFAKDLARQGVKVAVCDINETAVSTAVSRIENEGGIAKGYVFDVTDSKSVDETVEKIVSDFGGQVPSTLEELKTLPGVGRKTANVVYAVGFGGDAIAVDTHVYRVSRRIGLSRGNTPQKVEEDLQKIFDKKDWSHAHHLLILHGRRCCEARRPNCNSCNLKSICRSYGKYE